MLEAESCHQFSLGHSADIRVSRVCMMWDRTVTGPCPQQWKEMPMQFDQNKVHSWQEKASDLWPQGGRLGRKGFGLGATQGPG